MKNQRNRLIHAVTLGVALTTSGLLSPALQANTADNIINGQSNLSAAGTYSAGLPTSTSDVTFLSATTYSPTTFTVASGSALNFGTLNDLDATQSLTIQNAPAVASPSTITLNGGTNSVAPDAADLLYVASGGTFTFQNNNSSLGLTLAAAGNLDIAGTASISSIVTMGSNAITKTGVGTLTINGANSGTGVFTIADGTVSTNNNTGLGSTNRAVSLGLTASANNATVLFTGAPTGVQQNFTVATGTGTRTITSTNGTAFGSNGVVFSSANTITLNHDLITSVTNVGNIQFRGVISGGSGLIVDSTNTGYIQLNAANTFTGGVAINGGNAVVGVASVGSVGSITSSAFGTGAVTLGSGATAATLGINGAFSVLNSLTVASGGTRTLAMLNNGSTAGTYSGPISLSNDLILLAGVTTAVTGNDRLRVGGGGITGSNNIIVNNFNTATGAVANSGAIRLDGSGTATAWTGNLIVQGGQGSLGNATATGTGNTVGVTSGALFNFASGNFNPTVAGLANASAGALGGTTGGTVYHNQATNQTLTLGGSGTYSFAGSITNALNGTNTTSIVKSGSGTQTLSGTNTYTGTTTINGGTLLVNGSLASGSAVAVNNTATLGGSGSLGAVVVASGGTLAPGNSPGTLTSSSLTLNGGANYAFQLMTDGTGTSGTDWDSYVATGALDISALTTGSTFVFKLQTLANSTTPGLLGTWNDSVNHTWANVIDYGSLTGTFVSNLFTVDTTNFTNPFTGNFSIVQNGTALDLQYTAVPEPSTYALLGLGLTSLWFLRRKKKV